MLKKTCFALLGIISFFPLLSSVEKKPVEKQVIETPQQVIRENQMNNTDVYAIPYDDSEAEDDEELKYLHSLEQPK